MKFSDGKATDYIPIEIEEGYEFVGIWDSIACFKVKDKKRFGLNLPSLSRYFKIAFPHQVPFPSKIGDQDTFTCDHCNAESSGSLGDYNYCQVCECEHTITGEVYKIEVVLNPKGEKPGNYFRRDWRKRDKN